MFFTEPKLNTKFSIIPSMEDARDAKDVVLFDLRVWHDAGSSAKAHSISIQLVSRFLFILVGRIK